MKPSLVLTAGLALGGLAFAAPAPPSSPRPAADLIVTHARIFTGEPTRPDAQAVAIIGERIVAVGSDADVAAWRGPATRFIDAAGRRVVPGFNDAHVHFVAGGMDLDNIDLKNSPSPAAFVKSIGERAARTPKEEWLL